jgi:hypothetical protein
MKIALITMAMLGSQSTFPVSDQVPQLNVRRRAGRAWEQTGQVKPTTHACGTKMMHDSS